MKSFILIILLFFFLTNLFSTSNNYKISSYNYLNLYSELLVDSPLTIIGNIVNVDCYGNSTGSIYISVNGGISPYTYSWNTGIFTEDLVNINAGFYTLTVTDNNFNTLIKTFEVIQPNELNADIDNNDIYLLNEGFESYNVNEFPYSGGWIIKRNGAGNSFQIVTNTESHSGNKCLKLKGKFGWALLIYRPLQYSPDIVYYEAWAKGGYGSWGMYDNSEGTVGYQYNKINFTSNNIAINGGTSIYYVHNRDTAIWYKIKVEYDYLNQKVRAWVNDTLVANDLSVYFSLNGYNDFVIGEGSGTVFYIDDIKVWYRNVFYPSCKNYNNGKINLNVFGGSPNFSYLWDNGATTEDLTNVTSGSYNVTITDANSCNVSTGIIITEPEQLNASSVITNSCISKNNGAINLSINGGTIPYIFNWSNYLHSEDLIELSTGSYIVTITDANYCQTTDSFTISESYNINNNIYIEIYEGEVYLFGTQTLNTTGFFSDTFPAQNGCDSIVNINLTVIDNPLPINLLLYKIICTSTGSLISWATASETNNDYFTVEKTTDLKNWKLVSNIVSAFDSKEIKNYKIEDNTIVSDQLTYYRLKQTDKNGDFKFFDVLSILCSFPNDILEIIGVNVSEKNVNIILKTNGLDSVFINLHDINGKLLSQKTISPIKGANTVSLSANNLSPGTYLVSVIQNETKKTKKIILN